MSVVTVGSLLAAWTPYITREVKPVLLQTIYETLEELLQVNLAIASGCRPLVVTGDTKRRCSISGPRALGPPPVGRGTESVSDCRYCRGSLGHPQAPEGRPEHHINHTGGRQYYYNKTTSSHHSALLSC